MNKRRQDASLRLSKMLRDIQLKGVTQADQYTSYGVGWNTMKACISLGYLEKIGKNLFPKYQYVTAQMLDAILNKSALTQREEKIARKKNGETKPLFHGKQIDASNENKPTMLHESLLESLSDLKLVEELRSRGYIVSASKTIEL